MFRGILKWRCVVLGRSKTISILPVLLSALVALISVAVMSQMAWADMSQISNDATSSSKEAPSTVKSRSMSAKKPPSKKSIPPVEEVTPAVANEQKILAKYSLEELNSAGTYLMAVFEASLDGKKTSILECDPEPTQAQLWLSGPLHALIDLKTETLAAQMKKNLVPNLKKDQKKWRACAATCQCNAYLGVTELIESKDKLFTKLAAEVGEENKKQSAEASKLCASKQGWFCKSELQDYLSASSQP